MLTKTILGLLLLVLSVTANPIKQKTPLHWKIASLTLQQGHYALLKCQGHLGNPLDVIKVDHHFMGKVFPIYTGSEINPLMKNRLFSKQRKADGDSVSLEIIIIAIQGEDGGEYSCYSSSSPHLPSSLSLSVSIPIQSLVMRNKGNFFATQGALQMRQGQKSGIECIASMQGTLEAPLMRVQTDQERDITHLFVHRVESVEEEMENGLPQLKSTSYLTYETSSPDHSLNDRSLTCKATMQQKQTTNIASISTTLNVQYEPSIECDKYDYEGKLGDSLTIRCTISSQPISEVTWEPLENKSMYSWLSRLSRNVHRRRANSAHGQQFSSELLQKHPGRSNGDVTINSRILEDNKIVHELRIPSLQPQHFTAYSLKATNAVASKQVSIKIEKI